MVGEGWLAGLLWFLQALNRINPHSLGFASGDSKATVPGGEWGDLG